MIPSLSRTLAWLVCSAAGISPLLALPAHSSISIISRWQASPVLIQYVEFSPDGSLLVTADGGGVGALWQTTGKRVAVLKGQRAPMFRAHFHPSKRTLTTTGYDGTGWIWNTQGQLVERFQFHQAATADTYELADSFAPARFVSSSDDGTVVFHDQGGKAIWSHQFSGTTRQLRPSSLGNLIAASSDNGQLHLVEWAGHNATTVHSYQTPHGRINLLRFSPDQQQIAVAGTSGTVSLFSRQGAPQIRVQASDRGWSRGVAFCNSPQGDTFITIGDDGSLRQWSADGKLISSLLLSPQSVLTGVDCKRGGNEAVVVNASGELWMISVRP